MAFQDFRLPPGVIHLLTHIPKLSIPPTVSYALIRTAERVSKSSTPGWWMGLALFLSLPVTLTVKVNWRIIFRDKRGASRAGAVMPPLLQDAVPGGFMSPFKNVENVYYGDFARQHAKKYGTTHNRRILFENRYITTDPELIKVYLFLGSLALGTANTPIFEKAILATQFNEFEKGPEISRLFYPVLGTGVFAVDGETWKLHRAMARPFFSKDRISHFDNFDRHAKGAVTQMKARFEEGYAVDFQDVVARFTLDSATGFLFGNDVRSLLEDLPYPYHVYSKPQPSTTTDDSDSQMTHSATQFVKAFTEALEIIAFRTGFGDHWPLIQFWKDGLVEPMSIVNEYLDAFVRKAISKKMEEEASKIQVDKNDETFLENMVNSTEDPAILRHAILNMLVAGRDTTASALTFAVYMLAEHPDVFKRLRKEILTAVGPDRRPAYEDLKDMKFLRAVINETLRLYPPVPVNLRVSKATTIIPGKGPDSPPLYVPANIRYGILHVARLMSELPLRLIWVGIRSTFNARENRSFGPRWCAINRYLDF